MNKREGVSILIVLFFIIAIFSSGCTDSQVDTEEESDTTTPEEEVEEETSFYLGGDQGLSVSFPSNEPPSQIQRYTPFEISFRLNNKGEYTISNINRKIQVFISGISPHTYGLSKVYDTPEGNNLKGKEKKGSTTVPGDVNTVTFSSTGYIGPAVPSGAKWEQILNGRVCYPYKTKTVSTICLKENIYKESLGNAPCTISGEKEFENSGAPIQITEVEETPTGENKVAFRITIENKGNSQPYIGSISNCESLDASQVNKIILSDMRCGNLDLKCVSGCSFSGGGTIVLYNNQATITIEGELSNTLPSREYEETLILNFDYNYFEDISKKISVVGS